MELVFDDDQFVGAFTSRMELLRAMVLRMGYDDELVVRFFGTHAYFEWALNDHTVKEINERDGSNENDLVNIVWPLVDTYNENRIMIEFLMGQSDLHIARLIQNYFAPDGFHKELITIYECYDGPRLDDDDMNFVYMGLLRRDLNERLRFLAFVPIKKPIEGNVICRVWRMLV